MYYICNMCVRHIVFGLKTQKFQCIQYNGDDSFSIRRISDVVSTEQYFKRMPNSMVYFRKSTRCTWNLVVVAFLLFVSLCALCCLGKFRDYFAPTDLQRIRGHSKRWIYLHLKFYIHFRRSTRCTEDIYCALLKLILCKAGAFLICTMHCFVVKSHVRWVFPSTLWFVLNKPISHVCCEWKYASGHEHTTIAINLYPSTVHIYIYNFIHVIMFIVGLFVFLPLFLLHFHFMLLFLMTDVESTNKK